MISIIVPVYKVERYLSDCLTSVIKQSYKDLEIILVDDGSPDSCPDICDEISRLDSRIKVIHKPNGGLSSARNAGMEIATGDFITFLDSDDTIEPLMYERMLDAIKKYNVDICMCGSNIVDSDNKLIASDFFEEGKIYQNENLITDIILPLKTASWNKLYKRELICNHQFPVGRIHGEDLVFFIDIIDAKTKMVTTEYIGYHYYKRGNSITTSTFSCRSLDEVWCKDKAAELLNYKFPKFRYVSMLWQFRSRMNIMRSIISSRYEDQYQNLLNEYTLTVRELYPSIKKYLRLKDKVEYFFKEHIPFLYFIINNLR